MARLRSVGDAFVRTRVARRIVLLFVLCAMVPVASLALISYMSVSGQLRERAADRLYRGSKSSGLALMQRLQSMEWDLKTVARRMTDPDMAGRWEVPEGTHFSGVGVANANAALPRVAEMDAVAIRHMQRGKAALFTEPGPRGFPRTLMAILPDTANTATVVWAEVDPVLLWGPPLTEASVPEPGLCIIRDRSEVLFCPPRIAPRILGAIESADGSGITFEWESEEGPWLAASWPLFMRYYFEGSDWKIISSEPRADVMAPLQDFTRAYTLILFASLALVALLSLAMIRRNMDPLADLHAATKRIAARDFDVRVAVKSDDEFRALADSFNTMAHGLGRQFQAMNAMLGVGQDLLSARDDETIARAALAHATAAVPCRAAALLLRPDGRGRIEPAAWVTAVGRIEPAGPWDAGHLDGLFGVANSTALPAIGSESSLLPAKLTSAGASTHLLFPIRSSGEVVGALAFALDGELASEDILYARQLSDNVAVALGGASLLTELNDLSWGSLRALARAIDAKSPWTAGHSDRVTALATALGRHLQLDPADLERIERGGLLHDIGKIGVSSGVLDKEGPLSAVEWDEMRAHTSLGGNILEPIARYVDILPIVVHHHERWDGGGYPGHVAGDAIPYLARVLSLADVYDALTSDRPYREAMTPEKAICMIEAGLGTQFDPAIGRAFIEMMRQGEPEEHKRAVPLVSARRMTAVAGG